MDSSTGPWHETGITGLSLLQVPLEGVEGLCPAGVRPAAELSNIEPAASGFAGMDRRLGPAQFRGQVALGKPRGLAEFFQDDGDMSVAPMMLWFDRHRAKIAGIALDKR